MPIFRKTLKVGKTLKPAKVIESLTKNCQKEGDIRQKERLTNC